jgi:hypothetical protein
MKLQSGVELGELGTNFAVDNDAGVKGSGRKEV